MRHSFIRGAFESSAIAASIVPPGTQAGMSRAFVFLHISRAFLESRKKVCKTSRELLEAAELNVHLNTLQLSHWKPCPKFNPREVDW